MEWNVRLWFSRKEYLKKCKNFKNKGVFRGAFMLALPSSPVFCLQNRDKWGWCQGHNELFPKYLD